MKKIKQTMKIKETKKTYDNLKKNKNNIYLVITFNN